MSTLAKQRIITLVLGLLILSPGVHHLLAQQVDFDPWEFFGWSMYALPAARVQVRVDVERDCQTLPLRAMGDMRRRVKSFARRRTALGALVSTEPLAREVLAADSTIDAVIIVTREIVLDRESSLLVARDVRHRHERDDTNKSGA